MVHVRQHGYPMFDEPYDNLDKAIERCKQLRYIYIASDYYVEDGHGFLMFPKGIKHSEITPFNTRHEEYEE